MIFGLALRQGLKYLSIVLILALVVVFVFGSFVHAVVPHSHDGSEAVWQKIHAALHAGERAIFAASILTAVFSVFFVARAIPIPRAIFLTDEHVRRGVAKYRRFG
jgi:Na+/pantothenate symporter